MSLLIRIDGKSHRQRAAAKISIFDHGFLFGDSVYEVMRTHAGKLWQVEQHLDRLLHSAGRISLTIGKTKGELAVEIEGALREARCSGEAYIRLIVTRGEGDMDINPASCVKPTIIVVVKDLVPWPDEFYERGIDVAIVSTIRNGPDTVDPSIKTGNYLNSVLAIIEARKRGAVDAVMLNAQRHLAECTTSNLFFVKGGVLLTPALECGILAGVTRGDVVRLAVEDEIPCKDGAYPAGDLRGADEAFITSTTRGIMPIMSVDGRPLGDPEVGRPVTARLMDLLQAEIDRFTGQSSPAA